MTSLQSVSTEIEYRDSSYSPAIARLVYECPSRYMILVGGGHCKASKSDSYELRYIDACDLTIATVL